MGVVTRELAPEGIVHVGAEDWTARAETGTVPKGARVQVVAVDGLRLRVRPIDAAVAESAGERGGSS